MRCTVYTFNTSNPSSQLDETYLTYPQISYNLFYKYKYFLSLAAFPSLSQFRKQTASASMSKQY